MRSQTEIHFDPLSSGRDSVPELPRLIERVGASSRSEGPDLALLGIGAGPLPGQLPIRRRPGRSRRAEALLLASALVGLGSIALAATIARLPAAGPPAASRPNAAPVAYAGRELPPSVGIWEAPAPLALEAIASSGQPGDPPASIAPLEAEPLASTPAPRPEAAATSRSRIRALRREPAPSAPSSVAPPSRGRGDEGEQLSRDTEALLEGYLSGDARQVEPPATRLPITPSRGAVASALREAGAQVRACFEGESGLLEVRVSIEGASGRVRAVRVSGEFAGTPGGSCAARALRTLRLPEFSQERLEVSFPYRI